MNLLFLKNDNTHSTHLGIDNWLDNEVDEDDDEDYADDSPNYVMN